MTLNVVHLIHADDKISLGDYISQWNESLKEKKIAGKVVFYQSGQSVFDLVSGIRKEGADIVHIHNIRNLEKVVLAGLFAQAKCVCTVHQRSLDSAMGFFWSLNKAVVFASQNIKEETLRHNRIPEEKTRVVYDGYRIKENILSEEEKLRLKNQLGIAPGTLVACNIGRLGPEEDHASLLKTFRKLIKKNINIVLLVAGEGPLREMLVKMADNFGLAEKVKFLGKTVEPDSLLQVCDILVQSTIKEGLHAPILQAMAYGRAVVATKIYENTEIIEEGKTGYIVPCGFPERTESALMRFYVSRDLIKLCGEAGAKRFQEFFSWEAMCTRYTQIYQNILK